MKKIITPDLKLLHETYSSAGFSLWMVGGACRDALAGKESNDVDLCTDATPNEQLALLEAANIRSIPTGLQHGTVTAVINDEGYEITTLRTESDHDGRHATMHFCRNLEEDLSRRDLTINAIAMDFDGNVIDPFGGQDDLANGQVRFVGDAEQRMKEDYLRILRYFRFVGRYGDLTFDEVAINAVNKTRDGLSQISVERIWSEMSKIISGPNGVIILRKMQYASIFEVIGMPNGNYTQLKVARDRGIRDPASLLGFFIGNLNKTAQVCDYWKLSNSEKGRALMMSTYWDQNPDWYELLNLRIDGVPDSWVEDLARWNDIPLSVVEKELPVFPVNGNDLIKLGFESGPELGKVLNWLQSEWRSTFYILDRDELISRVRLYGSSSAE